VSDPTPRMGSAGTLVTIDAPDGPAAHAYLAMAAMLREEADGHRQVIAVTGPGKEEGKTTTTANLGVALSTGGSRVAVLSGDLREPRLHELFDRGNEKGLTTLMTDGSGVADILQLTEVDELILIASGPPIENPTELLGGERMRKLLDVLRTGFDFILLDTGPGLVLADVLLLAPLVDGFIVVADAARTSREDVSHLRTRLEGAGGKVIGGVLTSVELKHAKRDLSTLPEAMWERARQRTEPRAARVDGARDTAAPAAARTPTPRSPATGKSDEGTHPSASSKQTTDSKTEPVATPEAVRSGTSSSGPTPSMSKSARSTTKSTSTKSTEPAAAPKPKSARSSGSSSSRGSKASSSGSTPKARAGRPSTTDAPDEALARGEAPDREINGTPEGGPTRAPVPALEEATSVPAPAPEFPSPAVSPTDSEDPVDVRTAPRAPDDGLMGATGGSRNDDETEPDGPPGRSDGNGQVRRPEPATPADEPPRGGR
jgi:protein-tyrosine kinase